MLYILVFCFHSEEINHPNCVITPMNPSVLAGSKVINVTSSVIIKCICVNANADFNKIRWYSPDKKEITDNNAESEDTPYLIQNSGTLVFPIFSDSHQGIYYCGVGKDSVFVANINLTLWTGMYVQIMYC